MGMSASQARFLCLTARKNNVEFEGQQINQQRTSLSNESGSYYSELCNMVVPTPPSVDDYTKVSYTFDDGALTNTITSMIAKGNNEYSISYIQQWQDDYSIVSASSSIIAQEDDKYKVGSAELRKLGQYDALNVDKDPYLSTLDENQLKDLMEQETYYQSMLNDKIYNDPASTKEWYVRYVKDSVSGSYIPYFYEANAVENDNNYVNNFATSNINCYSLGSATKTNEILNALGRVEKDSTGRYLSIALIEFDDEGNEIVKEYPLTTNTSTDEDAYNDALNKYNYEQYQYDQKVQEINSKIEIVQQQDKALELELKRLDTEETAISTEMEAVKKVLTKNIETTFKTFNA